MTNDVAFAIVGAVIMLASLGIPPVIRFVHEQWSCDDPMTRIPGFLLMMAFATSVPVAVSSVTNDHETMYVVIMLLMTLVTYQCIKGHRARSGSYVAALALFLTAMAIRAISHGHVG